MILSKAKIEILNDTGEILILGLFALAIMGISFAFDKLIKCLKIKKSNSENVIVAKLKWGFFYVLFTEGLVEVLVAIAETIILIVEQDIKDFNFGYQIGLLIARVLIVIFIVYQSTKFLYSKPLLNDKMKKTHSALFQDFKVSKDGLNFKNYPTFVNLLTLMLRILIVMMLVLEPLHNLKSVTMIEI